MLNLEEAVRVNPSMNKLAIGDFLFAEFTCGIGAERLALWSPTDYLVNVVTGKKTWHTAEGVWTANPGETLFFKKGAAIVDQHFEVDFCLLMFFVPDSLVRATVQEVASGLKPAAQKPSQIESAVRVKNDVALSAFFQSMRSYFAATEKPSEALLRLKLKELVVSILTSNSNPGLAAYFRRLGDGTAPVVAAVMEQNFRFNLSLEEYARLCHRSLSSFKRDFQVTFRESPGKWLLRKRLAYAAAQLRSSKANVTQVAFESGFEDVSHFSRTFKARFGVSPVAYRQVAVVGE